MEFDLVNNIVITPGHIVEVKAGSGVCRVILGFNHALPGSRRLIKPYYVWMTEEYVDEQTPGRGHRAAGHRAGLTPNDYINAAHTAAALRFKQNGNEVPPEEGISLFHDAPAQKLDNASAYVHPVEHS